MDNNSVARVYQFLSQQNYSNLNEWKQAVDEEGGNNDGIIEKHEVCNFLEKNFEFQDGDNKDDIVNRFWASIDVKTTGNVGLSGISNKNALDNDELAKMELGLQASNRVSQFIQDKQSELTGLALKQETKNRCIESIKSGVLNKVLNYIKTKNISSIDSITNDVLEGFYKTVSKTAVADYAATEVIADELVKLGFPKDDKEKSYPIESDKTWKKIRDAYVNGFKNENDNTTLANIITGAKELAAAYADTANTNKQTSVDKLGSSYNTDKLNDLQVAVLTKSIKEAINNRLKDKEIYKLFGSEIDAKIPAFISNKLNKKTASEFVSLKGQVGTWAGDFETNELSDINTKYTQFKEKRDNLKTFVNEELSKEDNKSAREAAAQTAFGTSVLNDITKDEGKIDKMNVAELETADTNFRAAIAAIKPQQQDQENSDTNLSEAFKTVSENIDSLKSSKLTKLSSGTGNIHTEFGVDASGDIVFEQNVTTNVYNNLRKFLKSELESVVPDALSSINDKTFDRLLQAAWITTYNDFNSSTSNERKDFIKKVLENFKKILSKISTNPELLDIFTRHTAYANSEITSNVEHYGLDTTYNEDQEISYRGEVTTDADGTVHIANDIDDVDYQSTMFDLLKNLKAAYSQVNSETIKNVFQKAQKKAIETCQNNTNDCPYGTTFVDSHAGRSVVVTGHDDNWDCHNREEDEFGISMQELVELTLYYFDKLLYAELVK